METHRIYVCGRVNIHRGVAEQCPPGQALGRVIKDAEVMEARDETSSRGRGSDGCGRRKAAEGGDLRSGGVRGLGTSCLL